MPHLRQLRQGSLIYKRHCVSVKAKSSDVFSISLTTSTCYCVAATDCANFLTASRDCVTHGNWGTATARWSSHTAGAMILYCLPFILLPFLGDDSWWLLPSIGIRTMEACPAASIYGLTFHDHGMVAPLGKQLVCQVWACES